ncbi:flagellar protein FliT [Vibrio agarivorans]|uniref:Flagellar protein FliT n=1 Tax=Vibrio agarivorans TaxID=153622 RepID=A0ABT7XXV6_9VIBR|nr:flagellar protein FliT [Vibrio agarivorans]MDN2480608.1 flagellar protein FliT [Vibrio agarivorans]
MSRYQDIHELDHKISVLLQSDQLNTEEFHSLVDTRKRKIDNALSDIKQQPSLAQDPQWLALVAQTKTLVEKMQSETLAAGQALSKYRKGVKSVQQYKRFL